MAKRHIVSYLSLRGLAELGLVLGCASAVLGAELDESSIKLKEGPERVLVQADCSVCHSVDYIQPNSVFLDHKGWEATVNKMINVFGAPVQPGDSPNIVDYLVRNYGK